MGKTAKTDHPADVLVVDDVADHAAAMAEGLTRAGHRCDTASSGAEAVARLQSKRYDVVVTDLVLGGNTDGMAVLRAAQDANPETLVILVTAHGDIPTAVEAVKRGAFHFIEKPVDIELLRAQVHRAAAQIHARRAAGIVRVRETARPIGAEDGILGRSPRLLKALERIRKLAPTKLPVLLTGPNGAGKELFAHALHERSPRAGRRFVAINCAGIPESLLEDELFGHVRGGFTDAKNDRAGKFEFADGGTLFLDEIGDMPIAMQAKLLRVLETGEVTRLGSNDPVHVDVRVISATNQDLAELIAARRFRQDLYYRLGAEVRVPALADRPEDVPLLAEHFLSAACREYERPALRISPEALRLLCEYRWPGNVRQLRQLMQLLAVEVEGDRISPADLPPEITAPRPMRALPVSPAGRPYPGVVVAPAGSVHPAGTIGIPSERTWAPVGALMDAGEAGLLPVGAGAGHAGAAGAMVPIYEPDDEPAAMPIGDAGGIPFGGAGMRADGRSPLVVEGSVHPVDELPRAADGQVLSELQRLEREAIRRALAGHQGNRARAAKQLGMGERTLYRKLKEYGLG